MSTYNVMQLALFVGGILLLFFGYAHLASARTKRYSTFQRLIVRFCATPQMKHAIRSAERESILLEAPAVLMVLVQLVCARFRERILWVHVVGVVLVAVGAAGVLVHAVSTAFYGG